MRERTRHWQNRELDSVAQRVTEGLLISDSPEGAVRLGLPLRALRYRLPDRYPEDADEWSATAPATTSP